MNKCENIVVVFLDTTLFLSITIAVVMLLTKYLTTSTITPLILKYIRK